MSLKKTTIFFLLIMVVATFLRLYRFEMYLEFLDDQGRDALIIKKMLIDHTPTLLGPGTSVGKMYLGPLYYYAMIPFLAMTYPEPTGPAYAMAVFGILTVALLYVWGRTLIGDRAALIATLLYAVSPIIVRLSRFSWQPNPAPLVGLVMMWLTYQAVYHKKTWYWVGIALCFAVLSQLHYVALLSAIPSGILLAYDMWRNRLKKNMFFQWFGIGVLSLGIFLISAVPLVVFDIRHDHLILKGFQEFFAEQQRPSSITTRIWRAFTDLHGRSMFMTAEVYGFSKELRWVNTGIVILLSSLGIFLTKRKQTLFGVKLVVLWVVSSVIGLSLYPDTIYSHYVAFLFPASFLLLGIIIDWFMSKFTYVKFTLLAGCLFLAAYNIQSLPFWEVNPGGYREMRRVAMEVAKEVQHGERYNIALLNSNREYRGMKYRYFFSITPNRPQSEYDYERLDALVVFVENGEEPIKSPIFEIQEFLREHPKYSQMTVKSYPGIVDAYIFRK